MFAYNVCTIVMVSLHICCVYGPCLLFLCTSFAFSICLQNVKMRTRINENYRCLALKYDMIDENHTLLYASNYGFMGTLSFQQDYHFCP